MRLLTIQDGVTRSSKGSLPINKGTFQEKLDSMGYMIIIQLALICRLTEYRRCEASSSLTNIETEHVFRVLDKVMQSYKSKKALWKIVMYM